MIVFDEVFGFIPPHPKSPATKRPMVALMKQAQAYGVGCAWLLSLAQRLSQLYVEAEAHLSKDTKRYRADDAVNARKAADRIMSLLGPQRGKGEWSELSARAYTRLKESYDEVRRVAEWLFRNEPKVLASFPSPFSVNASRSRAPTSEGEPGRPVTA